MQFDISDMTPGNSAVVSGNQVILTPNNPEKVGTIWSSNKINLNEDFIVHVDLYFGLDNTTADDGGDGIAFVLQSSSSNAGTQGGGLGYEYINPSLTIEFDTHSNSFDPYDLGGTDPDPNDHITIIKNGEAASSAAHSEFITPIDIGNLEDGAWHTVEIKWNATDKTLELTVDGVVYIPDVFIDISATIFSGNPNVYFGFTASTGDAFNEQSVKFVEYCVSYDTDEDTIIDSNDNCPTISNTEQLDTDGDGIGDACDDDIDGDGIINDNDICPLISNVNQLDFDGDGIGDVCDDDIDGDGVMDTNDLCPNTPLGVTVNSDGCIYIDCESIPEIESSSNRVCPNEPVYLSLYNYPVMPGTTYLWSTGETTEAIEIYPIENETYWVDVTIENTTCRKEITVNVSDITFPKFFTPNGDGINDTWQIGCLNGSIFTDSVIYIFNRYGKLVAQINPFGKGWDGIYNGQPLPSTDYWFTFQFKDASGNVRVKKGNFSLIRR